jgi:hypothetical protein
MLRRQNRAAAFLLQTYYASIEASALSVITDTSIHQHTSHRGFRT